MAVRKIPLKRRPYLADDATGSSPAEAREGFVGEGIDSSNKSLDSAVQEALALVRQKVLSDRALYDKVSPVSYIATHYAWRWLGLRKLLIPSPISPCL